MKEVECPYEIMILNSRQLIIPRETYQRRLPTHFYIDWAKGLSAPSVVELEQIKTIDKMRIQAYLGRISKAQMAGVEEAIRRSLGLEIPECVEAP